MVVSPEGLIDNSLKKLDQLKKENLKQGKPVTVQVAQNVPTVVLKKYKTFFQISAFLFGVL